MPIHHNRFPIDYGPHRDALRLQLHLLHHGVEGDGQGPLPSTSALHQPVQQLIVAVLEVEGRLRVVHRVVLHEGLGVQVRQPAAQQHLQHALVPLEDAPVGGGGEGADANGGRLVRPLVVGVSGPEAVLIVLRHLEAGVGVVEAGEGAVLLSVALSTASQKGLQPAEVVVEEEVALVEAALVGVAVLHPGEVHRLEGLGEAPEVGGHLVDVEAEGFLQKKLKW